MSVLTPVNRGTPGTASNLSPTLTLRVGQLIKASTVSGTPDGRIGGSAVIRIGNEALQVRSLVKLSAGDQLTLRVSGSHPRTWLSVVSINNNALAGLSSPPLEPYLMQLQPRQGGLPTLFTALNSLLGNQAAKNLPPEIKQLSELLLRSLSSRTDVTQAAALRNALLQSGLFLEAQLGGMLQGKDARLEGDLKALILTLLNRLKDHSARFKGLRNTSLLPDLPPAPRPPNRDSPPEPQARSQPLDPSLMNPVSLLGALRQAGEAALARIALHQITAAEHSMDGEACWLVEVPVRQGQDSDIVHLRIEREARKNSREHSPRWSVSLALDLPELGPVHIQINLSDTQISSLFWTENRKTSEIVQNEFARLRRALENQGLHVIKLACGEGRPPSRSYTRSPRSLIDTQA